MGHLKKKSKTIENDDEKGLYYILESGTIEASLCHSFV